ncbi:MAG: heat-shock protein Hsp20 [Solimicrobium sp.]|jgi:HSP20 family protein|nr:heat-shock protein Hsp20 [Solimicrobium sp.]
MSNLSLYDPLYSRLNSRLSRIFNHLGLSNPAFFDDEGSIQPLTMKLDVSEDDSNYVVHADLPGVRKEDIHVSIDKNQVSISAEIKNEREDTKEKNVIHSERYQGKVFRSFALASDVDEARAEAKFSDGVLELTLPKQATSSTGKQLTIQ